MTKSLRYTWPIFVYLIMVVFLYIGSLGEVAELVRLRELINVVLTIGAIYYLYTSPFSQTHFLPLFTLLIVRLMVPMLVPFNATTGVSFYMGSNMAVLFFYSLRTLHKEPIRKVDYRKLYLVGATIIFQCVYYGILVFMYEETEAMDRDEFFTGASAVNLISQIFIVWLVITHLRLLGKWEKDQLDEEEMELIEKIGEEHATKNPEDKDA
ncbi:MAG: hypothetical protein AAFR87_16100 [Bacteroidota bacterium]